MAYTDIDNPELYFQTKLYTGQSGDLTITLDGSEDMKPDFVWIKHRNGTGYHVLTDSVRGVTKYLNSDRDAAEATAAEGLQQFQTDGFLLGDNHGDFNRANRTYVAWNWKAGTSFSNDASATSVGSIDSAGSVSTDAGFSIISYTGTGANATIAHGLGSVPKMYIARNIDDAEQWTTYHVSMGATHHLRLNTNVAKVDEAEVWNDTEPTSTVFSVGSSGAPNGDGDRHIAYCFADVKGYSKFGNYKGNGNADGPFIYTGFQPAFVMTKRTDGSGDWAMMDTARNPFNVMNIYQKAHASEADSTDASFNIDSVSNGFKIRYNNSNYNADGGAYLYMAFAADPFVNSNGISNNAR